jgi:hypothetical protein
MSLTGRNVLAVVSAAGVVIVAVSSAQAFSVSPTHPARLPEITASVKVLSPTARLVHIVDNDIVAGHFFVVHSTDCPKILAASSPRGACKVAKVAFSHPYEAHSVPRALQGRACTWKGRRHPAADDARERDSGARGLSDENVSACRVELGIRLPNRWWRLRGLLDITRCRCTSRCGRNPA